MFASILRDGTFQKPLSLSPVGTLGARAAAVADPDGGIVSWGDPQRGVFSAIVRRAGLLESARQVTDSVVLVAADGGGDQVFTRALNFPPPALEPVLFVRPFGGGPDEPAPSATGEYAVSAPTGRAVALAWPGTRQVNLSVWRP